MKGYESFRHFFPLEDFRKLGIWGNNMLKMNEKGETFKNIF